MAVAAEFALDGFVCRVANAPPDFARRAVPRAAVAVSIVVVDRAMDGAPSVRSVARQRVALIGRA